MEKGTGETRGGTPAHGNRSSIAAGRRVFDSQVGEPAPHKSLVECANRPRTDRRALMRRPVAFGAVSSSQWLAERLGGVCWRSVLAERTGGLGWRNGLADRVGGTGWRTGLAERVGGTGWRSDLAVFPACDAEPTSGFRCDCQESVRDSTFTSCLAVSVGGVTWRSDLAE
jgi:hypothetical protein